MLKREGHHASGQRRLSTGIPGLMRIGGGPVRLVLARGRPTGPTRVIPS